MPSWTNDCPAYCCPSLGLGNAAGAGILEEDVWGALEIEQELQDVRAHDFPGYCWPSLGLGNAAGAGILEGDVWGGHWKSSNTCGCMIFLATVGPLWGSEIPAGAGILEGDVWGALRSEQHVRNHDCPGYCWPSLGLGNAAGAGILEGDVWGGTGNRATRAA